MPLSPFCYLIDQDIFVQLPLIPIILIDSDETSQNAGYDFTLDEVQDWLERQAVHQVHKPRPRFIPRVSFSSIQVPNEVHQADILSTGNLTSHTIARAFEKVYDDTTCPLTWPKLLITDRGSEFKGECEKLMTSHGVKIQKAKSKRTVGIVERYNRTLVVRMALKLIWQKSEI
uniref:Integrase catalytic domain-containing protein n=1 Tax=Rhizophagus irregularis (strain DAOM 181602 / DAOM 197198 / MUCL 43194) TaxID=747089 RepID=U9TWK4_RHIID